MFSLPIFHVNRCQILRHPSQSNANNLQRTRVWPKEIFYWNRSTWKRSKLLKIPYNQNVLSGNSLVWANFIGILVWSNYTEFFSQSNCSRCMFLIDTTRIKRTQENTKGPAFFVFSAYIVQFIDLCSALYCIKSFFSSFWFWYFVSGQRY